MYLSRLENSIIQFSKFSKSLKSDSNTLITNQLSIHYDILLNIESNSETKESLDNPLFDIVYTKFGNFGERYDSFLNSIFSSQYRYYFDVDNMLLLKNPSSHLHLTFIEDVGFQNKFKDISPTNNVHAPDLYLPLMSLVTFVFLRCLSVEINNKAQFNSGYIVHSVWKCLIISFLEVIIMKIVFYFLDAIRINTVDLISFLNYRYCSLCALVIFNFWTNNLFSLIGTIYVLICQTIFVFKTLQRYTPLHNQIVFQLNSFDLIITLLLSILQPSCSWIVLYFDQ